MYNKTLLTTIAVCSLVECAGPPKMIRYVGDEKVEINIYQRYGNPSENLDCLKAYKLDGRIITYVYNPKDSTLQFIKVWKKNHKTTIENNLVGKSVIEKGKRQLASYFRKLKEQDDMKRLREKQKKLNLIE